MGRDVLGSDTELVYDHGSEDLSCNSSNTEWVYTHIENDPRLLIPELFALNNISVKHTVPKRFVNAMQLVGAEGFVPWKYVMPDAVYQEYALNAARDVSRHFQDLDKDYYIKAFNPARRILDALVPAFINKKKYLEYSRSETNPTTQSVLETFQPDKHSTCKKITYDRFSSKTGRLTVSNGPNIMILKKDYRDIITSRFSGGRIVQLDYASFEARLALAFADKNSAVRDIYTFINNEVFSGELKRGDCKTATLGVLFGMGPGTLAELLGTGSETALNVIKKIKQYFNFDVTVKPLYDSAIESGSIKNFYGRKIMADSLSHGKIFNLFVQSTGVDAALLGFSKLLNSELAESRGFLPLFVLHDALIIDCAPETVKSLDSLAVLGESIPGLKGHFPLNYSFIGL